LKTPKKSKPNKREVTRGWQSPRIRTRQILKRDSPETRRRGTSHRKKNGHKIWGNADYLCIGRWGKEGLVNG